ncbi:MAG: hypothetical protein QXV01_11830, partial [Candidatus Bathyarchaeia archaeon]
PKTTEEKNVASCLIRMVENMLTRLNLSWLIRDFPQSYMRRYISDSVEFDEIRYISNKHHDELQPILTGQQGRGYAVYPHKDEDPIFVETEEKAKYLFLALKGKSARQHEEIRVPIPKNNSIAAKIVNDIEGELKTLQKFPVEQIEEEINRLVCHLYGLNEHDKAVIEDFLKKF